MGSDQRNHIFELEFMERRSTVARVIRSKHLLMGSFHLSLQNEASISRLWFRESAYNILPPPSFFSWLVVESKFRDELGEFSHIHNYYMAVRFCLSVWWLLHQYDSSDYRHLSNNPKLFWIQNNVKVALQRYIHSLLYYLHPQLSKGR